MQNSTSSLMAMLLIMATFTLAHPLGTDSNDLPNVRTKLPRSTKYFTKQKYKKNSKHNFINITEDISTHFADLKEQGDSLRDTLEEEMENIKEHQTRLEKSISSMADSLSSLSTSLFSPLPFTGISNGCVGGFLVSGQCLVFSSDKLSWQDAKDSCSAKNAKLVSLKDPSAFHEYATRNYDVISTEEDERFWLGGSDITSEGNWVWINGNEFGVQFPWPQSQPDDFDENEDCLQWGYGKHFNDALCTNKYRYVCQQVLQDITPFDEHITKYNIKFENAAEAMRKRGIINDNVKKIQDHNKLHDSGKTSYRKGVNEYSHLTYGEVLGKLTGLKISSSAHGQESDVIYEPINPGNEPSYLNYVEKGAVNPIRNQGECGSSWAFSTTSVIESHIKLKYEVLQQLSEQYLVDCDNSYYYGCNGGWPSQAIDYVKANGIAFAAEYQYTAQDGICNYNAPKTTYRITSEQSIRQGNDSDLLNALVNHGPISVAIYASDNFRHYKSGVFVDDECYDWVRPNHGVVLVGYGVENGQDYWLARNSWGTSWGEEGYIKMTRSQNNFCQISSHAIFPMVNDNNNDNDIHFQFA